MMGLIPLRSQYQGDALKQHCGHILTHQHRYVDQRVFEAKSELNNLKNKESKDEQ